MSLSRRKFIQVSAVTMAGIPLSRFTNNNWYELSEGTAENSDELFALFKDPYGQAKPFVRWWWNGSRIVSGEIIRELDLLKEAGIGGVEINTIAFPNTADPLNYKALDWLSDEWTEMLKTAVEAAKERGIICDIIAGSGWPFGGEFLEKDEQIQMLALGTKDLKEPGLHEIKKSDLLNEMDSLMTYKSGSMDLFSLRLVPSDQESFKSGIDLNDKINDEIISINAPAGGYVLYYLVKLTGYTAVTHGAPGASGPILNHYNKEAVDRYLNRMSDAITAKIGRMGDHFRSVFVDSLELRGSNWCDDMLKEFEHRRGYALEPYLPFILFKINRKSTYNGGQVLDGYGTRFSQNVQGEINRVRYDFEITRLELFHERFLETFTSWCKRNGVKSRVQAYGREYYPLKSILGLDIPECETWLRSDVGTDLKENTFKDGRAYRPVNKFVSSAARLTGKKIISCEEITNTSVVFNATLEHIKVTGDQSSLSGVTHSILHGFNYSPPEAPFPGWVRYGTFFSERNTWWPYLSTWIYYKARLSAVFQAAEMQSDIAIMFPMADMWSKFGLQYQQWPQIVYPEYAYNIWESIHQNGSGCDYINEHILQNSHFSDGRLHYGPRSYKVLLLPEVESITLQTVPALQKFAAAGGLIVFIEKGPVKSPGLQDHRAQDRKVSTAVQSLKKDYPDKVVIYPAPKDKIIDWYKTMQSKLNIGPFVKFDKPVSHVSQVYYKTAGADIFFISNYHLEKTHSFTAVFNVKNRTAWLWDPETGKKYRYPHEGDKNKLKISLGPAGSMLIVFTGEKEGELYQVRKAGNAAPLSISGPWDVALEKVNEKPQKIKLKELVDFKEEKTLQSFGGVIFYEQQFNVDEPEKYNYLDLGKVHNISEVEINGKPLGYKWYGQHIYRVSKTLKKGRNTIKIKVTTVLGNYVKSLEDNKTAQKWTAKQPLCSMGMLGPVKLS